MSEGEKQGSDRGDIAPTDHLDKETSLSLKVTPDGVEAKTKSRWIAAIDRLGGSGFDWLAEKVEAGTARRRAKLNADLTLQDAVLKYGIDRMQTDPEFGRRAIEGHFERIFSKQENKDAVLREAVEDLRLSPPSKDQAESGPEELSPPFMDRIEQYAEGASTEELRAKWGRVLASEIRNPGTFSAKVLRVVDELEPATAQLFERVCEHRIYDQLPLVTLGELPFVEQSALVDAGLLHDPGLGINQQFVQNETRNGDKIWFTGIGRFGFSLPIGATIIPNPNRPEDTQALAMEGSQPTIPVQVITAVGLAISTILPDGESKAARALLLEMRQIIPEARLFARSGPGWTVEQEG